MAGEKGWLNREFKVNPRAHGLPIAQFPAMVPMLMSVSLDYDYLNTTRTKEDDDRQRKKFFSCNPDHPWTQKPSLALYEFNYSKTWSLKVLSRDTNSWQPGLKALCNSRKQLCTNIVNSTYVGARLTQNGSFFLHDAIVTSSSPGTSFVEFFNW